MISREDMGYYTKALSQRLGAGYSFGPFDGRGLDLLLNHLVREGMHVSFYGQMVKGFGGHRHGTSYETVIFKGNNETPIARCERENYNESVTMAAVEALGLLKPVVRRARPNEYGVPPVEYKVVMPEQENDGYEQPSYEFGTKAWMED